jgi:hypothetical protein
VKKLKLLKPRRQKQQPREKKRKKINLPTKRKMKLKLKGVFLNNSIRLGLVMQMISWPISALIEKVCEEGNVNDRKLTV